MSRLKSLSIDHLFCPHQSFRTAWILKSISANKKVAFKNNWNFLFFNVRIPRDMRFPEPVRQMDLLASVDEATHNYMNELKNNNQFLNSTEDNHVRYWPATIPSELSQIVVPRKFDLDKIKKKWPLNLPFVVLAPSSQWNTKRWDATELIKLINQYAHERKNIFVIGSPAEVEYNQKIIESAVDKNSEFRVYLYNITGQTDFIELHALMSLAEAVIANDSGPMHFASSAGTHCVGIFGPTTLNLGYRPWSDVARVAQVDLPCRPCGKHGHNKCPLNTHDCMKKIKAEDVRSLASH
jgi:heptosyltransferase-2